MMLVSRTILVAVMFAVVCCGGFQKPPYSENPVDFAFTMGGEVHRVAELRGRPLIIFLVRISELTTELYMGEVLEAYKRSAGKTRFLVLSLAPNEEPMLAQYVEFNELPFSIGLAEWAVANGESELGPIPTVPSTYALGSDGRVVNMYPGATPADSIERISGKLQ